MSKSSSDTGTETLLVEFYRLLSPFAKRQLLVQIAELICERLPPAKTKRQFLELRDEANVPDEGETNLSNDEMISALLDDAIPWSTDVAQYVGDHFRDVLNNSLGDATDSWLQALGGWEGDDEWLIDQLISNLHRASDIYPGYPRNWEWEEVQDFYDSWRASFYGRLLAIAQSD